MNSTAQVGSCIECGAPTENGGTTLTFERAGIRIVISGVPAEICPNGHEPFLDGEVFEALGTAITELTRTLTAVGSSKPVTHS